MFENEIETVNRVKPSLCLPLLLRALYVPCIVYSLRFLPTKVSALWQPQFYENVEVGFRISPGDELRNSRYTTGTVAGSALRDVV